MPLSIWLGLEDCLQIIINRRPQSVLDAGIGFGLWGHLLRQYLDVWAGRIQPHQWRTRIDGIEIDPARVQPHARYLYSNIFPGDIRETVPRCAAQTRYDVILFGDVLEHLPKEESLALLDTAIELAGDLIVIRLPLGNGWRREGREPPDHHRSQWSLDDFSKYPASIRIYEFWGNPYALIAIKAGIQKEQPIGRYIDDLEQRLEKIEETLLQILGTDL